MAARRHINPNQLKLFMTAGELMNVTAGDSDWFAGTLASDTGLAKQKLEESKTGSENHSFDPPGTGPTLHESIKKHGVVTPVLVEQVGDDEMMLHNGHHRVVTANNINPDMFIPIRYAEKNEWDGWEDTSKEVSERTKKANKRKE